MSRESQLFSVCFCLPFSIISSSSYKPTSKNKVRGFGLVLCIHRPSACVCVCFSVFATVFLLFCCKSSKERARFLSFRISLPTVYGAPFFCHPSFARTRYALLQLCSLFSRSFSFPPPSVCFSHLWRGLCRALRARDALNQGTGCVCVFVGGWRYLCGWRISSSLLARF